MLPFRGVENLQMNEVEERSHICTKAAFITDTAKIWYILQPKIKVQW